MAAMEALGLRLVRLIALALRCPPDFFDAAFVKALTVLRPLHYNDEVSDPVLGLFGAGQSLHVCSAPILTWLSA